ncbi:hypothetical protein Leryth_006813 [Lithospermum erythrorhizon]|nr:hypothetical protein Leryth_006813 [Lithospermum erythrorhizon]
MEVCLGGTLVLSTEPPLELLGVTMEEPLEEALGLVSGGHHPGEHYGTGVITGADLGLVEIMEPLELEHGTVDSAIRTGAADIRLGGHHKEHHAAGTGIGTGAGLGLGHHQGELRRSGSSSSSSVRLLYKIWKWRLKGHLCLLLPSFCVTYKYCS